jgi:hypothetical protein
VDGQQTMHVCVDFDMTISRVHTGGLALARAFDTYVDPDRLQSLLQSLRDLQAQLKTVSNAAAVQLHVLSRAAWELVDLRGGLQHLVDARPVSVQSCRPYLNVSLGRDSLLITRHNIDRFLNSCVCRLYRVEGVPAASDDTARHHWKAGFDLFVPLAVANEQVFFMRVNVEKALGLAYNPSDATTKSQWDALANTHSEVLKLLPALEISEESTIVTVQLSDIMDSHPETPSEISLSEPQNPGVDDNRTWVTPVAFGLKGLLACFAQEIRKRGQDALLPNGRPLDEVDHIRSFASDVNGHSDGWWADAKALFICSEARLPLDRTVFIDDTELNVQRARAVGIRSRMVRPPTIGVEYETFDPLSFVMKRVKELQLYLEMSFSTPGATLSQRISFAISQIAALKSASRTST